MEDQAAFLTQNVHRDCLCISVVHRRIMNQDLFQIKHRLRTLSSQILRGTVRDAGEHGESEVTRRQSDGCRHVQQQSCHCHVHGKMFPAV